jgi:hypothetical protein
MTDEADKDAILATIRMIFDGHCASMSGPVFDSQGNRIVLTCSSPRSDTKVLLKAKKCTFSSWACSVRHHSMDHRSFDKVTFVRR